MGSALAHLISYINDSIHCLLLFLLIGLLGCSDSRVSQGNGEQATEVPGILNQADGPADGPKEVSDVSPVTVPENAASALSSRLPLSETSNARYLSKASTDLVHLDPRKEGWVTEVINDAVAKRLKALKQMIESGAVTEGSLAPMLSNEFQCQALRPEKLSVAYRDESFVAMRSAEDLSAVVKTHQGAQGFLTALLDFSRPKELSDSSVETGADLSTRVYFKVVGVSLDQMVSQTRVLVELDQSGSLGRIQQNAVWNCEWHPATRRGDLPQLAGIELLDYDSVWSESQGAGFVDCTEAVLGGNASFENQLKLGIDHWRERLDWRFTQMVTGPHGLAIGDVNGDELDDLFVCETGGLPNRLFIQELDGSLRDVSAESAVDYLEPSSSALIVDFDNDGDQDIVFSSGRNLVFLENSGRGHFERRLIYRSDSVARSLSAVDFNLDGRLDVYVCGYFSISGNSSGIGRPIPYHDANNGVRNYLLQNNDDFRFEDVTSEVGLEENNQRFTYAAAWEDYDNDGDLDLYVANDFGRNNLYRNDGGTFSDVAATAGVEDISAGMSVSWGDYNRDGYPDLYVGNMYSSAGNRVAFQRNYRADESESVRELFQRHARGNSLFLNRGDGTFRDVSHEAGVTMGRWAWGSNFADFNNDGWEDIIVANGLVSSPDDTGDL